MKRTFQSLVAIMAVAAATASAQTTNESLSLDALVAGALQNNPELNFYRAEIAAAKGERVDAGAWSNPEVGGEIGQKHAMGHEGLAWSVSVAQAFEYPGRLGLRKAIANRQIELAELGFEQFKTALAARVRSLGYALFIAQEKARAAREVSERGKELIEVLVQRDPAGITPLLETRIIEASILTLQHEANDAVKEAQAAHFELNQLLGSPISTPLAISDHTTLSFPKLLPVDDLLTAAITNNFALRMRRVELEQQGFRVELSRNDRWPALTLAPFYSEEKADERERTVGVGISLPLPLWNRNNGGVQSAVARQAQAATSLLLSQREVERSVRERAAAYQLHLEEMARWNAKIVEQLREAAELGDRHYRLGALPVSTYIELQEKYLEGLQAVLTTQAEALDDWQQLELLTGLKIERKDIQDENTKAP